VHMPI